MTLIAFLQLKTSIFSKFSCFEHWSTLFWCRNYLRWDLQWLGGYLGLALVFVWDSVQREGFFKGFLLVLVKLSFWQGGWVLAIIPWGLDNFLTFSIFLSFSSFPESNCCLFISFLVNQNNGIKSLSTPIPRKGEV